LYKVQSGKALNPQAASRMADADAERRAMQKPQAQATNAPPCLAGNWKTGNWKNETAMAYSYLDRGDFVKPQEQERTSIRQQAGKSGLLSAPSAKQSSHQSTRTRTC
jgi:hypothetical protein